MANLARKHCSVIVQSPVGYLPSSEHQQEAAQSYQSLEQEEKNYYYVIGQAGTMPTQPITVIYKSQQLGGRHHSSSPTCLQQQKVQNQTNIVKCIKCFVRQMWLDGSQLVSMKVPCLWSLIQARRLHRRPTYVQSDGQTNGRPQGVPSSNPLRRTSKHESNSTTTQAWFLQLSLNSWRAIEDWNLVRTSSLMQVSKQTNTLAQYVLNSPNMNLRPC